MKKQISILMMLAILVGLTSCQPKTIDNPTGGAVEITVVTPFRDSDGNRSNFVAAYKDYETNSGNIIIDVEALAVNEEWKAKVLSDFSSGNEPDVIFYFTGADADELIRNNHIVSISEIRREYPDYASNMKESLLPVSTYDGRQYAVSVNGYWEGLFVNKEILDACDIPIPGAEYTWEEFISDCLIIKENGYVPIACALGDIPHYWFEYSIFNNGSVSSHSQLPLLDNDDIYDNWVAGLNDIKELYELGFFPINTNDMSDEISALLFLEGEAAFLLEGSWKVGWILDKADNPDAFTVTYVPSKGIRKTTDAIGGFSMGYCITRKAWDDPQKRDACVEFVMAMTTDEVVSAFGALTVTALKDGVIPPDGLSSFAMSALAMTKGCTAMVPAVQDLLHPTARENLFSNIPNIVTGEITPEEALKESIS
ncbi:MAG: ABC transporter substrate-binding protein [Oscillospiraceae bacterium]|nr:ABC transporter substrate-binding protein [Oscillospiraceae bacterium]